MTILLFVVAILLPLYAGWRTWKRLNRPLLDENQLDSVEFLIRNLILSGATVMLGVWIGLSIMEFLAPAS